MPTALKLDAGNLSHTSQHLRMVTLVDMGAEALPRYARVIAIVITV